MNTFGNVSRGFHSGGDKEMALSSSKIPSEMESMLIIHQGAIGDFILALPALASLRKAFPKAKCVIMGYPRILQLVHRRFYAEEIVSIDQKGMATFFVQNGALDLGLSPFFRSFDLVVPFGKDTEGILIKNLKRVVKGQLLPINSFPKWDEGVHVSDHLIAQLEAYGIPIEDRFPRLYLSEEDRVWAEDYLKKMGLSGGVKSQLIVIHPGSGSRKKVWPLKKFLSLLQHLRLRTDSKFLIILGPAEPADVQKSFEEMRDERVLMVKNLSLLQLASLMEGCRLFIGNDSGISHMASALGLPTLVLFGPTDSRVWSPRGEKVLVLRREMPCSPCSEERFFFCKEPECLNGIEVEEALMGLTHLGLNLSIS